MNGPTRTHVFDEQPSLPELLRVWYEYGEPKRVEVSRALHTGLLTGPHSGDYRAWEEMLTERVIAEDDMLGNRALYLRTPIEPTTFRAADLAADLAEIDAKIAGTPILDREVGPVDRKVSAGKLLMNLVTSDLVRQAAAADTYGAEKYQEPGSWRNAPVEDVVRYVDAAERHLSDVKAYLVEGKTDRWLADDSKLSHLAHLAATVGILIEFAQRMGLPLPEEFDRHWERDVNDALFCLDLGSGVTLTKPGEWSAPDGTGVPE